MSHESRIRTPPAIGAQTSERKAPWVALGATLALAWVANVSCLGATPEAQDPRLSDPEWRGKRIEELRRAIRQDHATLEELISLPGAKNDTGLHDDPELRAIAARLGKQVRALERLEADAEAAR